MIDTVMMIQNEISMNEQVKMEDVNRIVKTLLVAILVLV